MAYPNNKIALKTIHKQTTWNTYDNFGEAYWNLDDKVLAIKNYKRSLELNPPNTNAVESLKKIEQPDNK
jgi:hypothetical protein